MAEVREAMLRPEFREWYPALLADRWYPARQLAELVLEQRRSSEPRWEFEARIPPDEHFLFRGGRTRGDTPARTRRSDTHPGSQSSHEQRSTLEP
jgi:hypothetical protein